MTKFSAEVPKGDGWGVEDVVASAVAQIQQGDKSPLIPVVGVIDIKELKIDPETHNVVAVVRIRRIESLTSPHQIRAAQRMIIEQWAARKGEGATLPFEDSEILERAFAGGPVGDMIRDDEEAKIDADLSDRDRMLRHIVAVHDGDPNLLSVGDPDAADDAMRWHDEQHAADPDGRTFTDHDAESTVWRRVDLVELGSDPEPEQQEDDPDGDSSGLIPLFSEEPDSQSDDS